MNITTLKRGILIPFFLIVFTSLPSVFTFGQGNGTFKDSRDGHIYRWTMFGKQAWMLGNLDFKTPAGSWIYNNDSTKEAAYGRLYDLATAQKACPKGWHLPSVDEWTSLITFLGGEDVAGGKLQDADSIPKGLINIKQGDPDNFCALLAGIRHPDGSYTGIGLWGSYWSSPKPKTDLVNNYLFVRHSKSVAKSTNDKNSAFSVKCVRNK
jgi:uncharacterized protein (TIGR02145 family)